MSIYWIKIIKAINIALMDGGGFQEMSKKIPEWIKK
jgi:hypothetical protein